MFTRRTGECTKIRISRLKSKTHWGGALHASQVPRPFPDGEEAPLHTPPPFIGASFLRPRPTDVLIRPCERDDARHSRRVLGVEYQYQNQYHYCSDRETSSAEAERNATLRVGAFPVHGCRVTGPAREYNCQRP